MAFRGTFDYTLDAKNRLTVPAKFRPQLSGGVVLAKGKKRCVTVWTPDGFDAYLEAALADLHPMSEQADDINRYFQANSIDIELDAAGRVMVPGFLLEHSGLTKDAMVLGAGDRLEIWDRQAWADYNRSVDINALTAGFGKATT